MRVRTAGYGIFQQKRSGRPFIIKVNYASGFTVTLPLYNAAGYNYNFIVDWGDGSVGQITSATDTDRVHAYTSGGTYTITMTGVLNGWLGNATGLKEYITEVTQWGRTNFKSVSLQNCTRLVSAYGTLQTTYISSLQNLFAGCTSLISIDCGDWDTSNITNLRGTFYGCSALTTLPGVSTWDVSKVTDFGQNYGNGIFSTSGLTSLDLSSWRFVTTGTTSFGGMFARCNNLVTIGDTSGWNTGNVISFYDMFNMCYKLKSIDADVNGLDVSTWDTSNVISMAGTFGRCYALTSLDLSNWNVSKVTSFEDPTLSNGFAAYCTGLTSLDLSGWRFNTTTNVSMGRFLLNCSNLVTIGDTSGWNTGKINQIFNAFSGCSKLKSIDADVNGLDVSTWDTSNVTSIYGLYGLFLGCSSLTTLDLSNWNVSTVRSFTSMCQGCSNLVSVGNLSSWRFHTTATVAFNNVFLSCGKLTSIGNTNGWNTGQFTTLETTFMNCYVLNFVDTDPVDGVDVSTWDTSNVTNMGGTFCQCYKITTIDVSGWNVGKVTRFQDIAYSRGMFQDCTGLTSLDLSGWRFSSTSSVLFPMVFKGCTVLTTIGDISGWNTAKITTFRECFYNCYLLNNINTATLDMSGVTDNVSMFYNCRSFTVLNIPPTLPTVQSNFAIGLNSITVYNFYPTTAPTVSGTPFGNYAKPLHVPVGATGYDVAPWTTATIFTQPAIDDL